MCIAFNTFEVFCAESEKTNQHLQNLYEVYKELEHVYALNLFYSGTQYECKPGQRSQQAILKNLSGWNGFIRSRLKDKNDFNAEEVEMIQILQLHHKDAQFLTDLCRKYNQWRHDHYQKREDFVKYAVQAIALTSDVRALESFMRDIIKNQFDCELEKIQIKEHVEYIASKNVFTCEWLDQIILEPRAIILDNFPELIEYEKEKTIECESTNRAHILKQQKNGFKFIKKSFARTRSS